MTFGIGLGAFVEGFQQGADLRMKLDERAERRDNKAALKNIETDAQAQFDSEVDAGTKKPEDFEQFWNDYALPRRQKELLRQGDVEGAQRLGEWGESAAARKGGKLFSSAMLKANTGDYAGALGDAIAAANVKGYVDHGYELKGQTELKDADGNVVGFRLTVNDGKKEIEQDVAIADIPKLIATFTNPDAAWASQQAAVEKQKGRGEELEDYEAKKKIDRKYPADKDGDYAKRYEATWKEVAKEHSELSDEPLDDAGIAAEVERRIGRADEFAASKAGAAAAPAPEGLGQPAPSASPSASGKRIVVDTVTGEQVDPSAVEGLGGSPAPTQAAPAPQRQTRAATKSALIADAADAMATGGNPEYVALQLNNAGIKQEEWPEQLRAAFTRGTAGPKQDSMAAGLGGY